MHAYQLNEHECWAGNTPEEAIAECMKQTGVDREDAVDNCVFTGKPVDENTEVWYDEELTRKISVKQILSEMTKPGFVFGHD